MYSASKAYREMSLMNDTSIKLWSGQYVFFGMVEKNLMHSLLSMVSQYVSISGVKMVGKN